MIEMITRPSEKVQTCMTARVDGVMVDYFRFPERLEYVFHVYRDIPQDRAIAAVNKLVHAMCDQSYDHGAEWRVVTESYEGPSEHNYNHVFKTRFRIKDTY